MTYDPRDTDPLHVGMTERDNYLALINVGMDMARAYWWRGLVVGFLAGGVIGIVIGLIA